MLIFFVILFVLVFICSFVFTKLNMKKQAETAEQEKRNKAAAVQRERDERKSRIVEAAIAAGLPASKKNDYTEYWLHSRVQACKVAGVTFKNGRRQRQTILKQIKFHDEPYKYGANIHLKKVEYEGEPAIEVWANEEQVGYIAKEDLPEVLRKWKEGNFSDTNGPNTGMPTIYGGSPKEDGTRTSYGMEFSILWPEECCPENWLDL